MQRLSKSRSDWYGAHPAYWIFLGVVAVGSAVYWLRKPTMNLVLTPYEFVSRLWPVLGKVKEKDGSPLSTLTKLIIVAHGAFESGWGKGTGAKLGFNYFNITAGPAWKGPVVQGPDTEYDKAGNVKNITQQFRKYGSDLEAVQDYLSFLSTQNGGRYLTAYAALMRGDVDEFLGELYKAGYFTLPVDQYKKSMAGVIDSVKRLLT